MEKAKLKTRTHKNVMSCVSNPSGSHFKPKYVVTRHATASSGAKPISSTVSNTSGFCDLPIALNDYIPETMSETVKRRTFVVKPKKTVKSLPPTVPPTVLKTRNARVHTNLYSRSSAPTVLNVLNSGRTLNSSTENSQRLKEIKDEIKAYHEKERNIKLSDSLHKKFGLQLHNDGDVADKGTQDVEQKDSHRGTPRETKEKKRQRNREYQRAWRQRHRDLKKKVLKEEKEAARRKRHRENQRAYYHRKKRLRESELNDELTQEKLEDLKLRRIWIEPCKKPDLEEKSISNKQNQSLCTLRFENKNGQNLLNKKSGPALLVPVSAFSSEKDKSTRNSAENVEAEKSQSERLKRHKLPETDSKEIKIKEEEDEFDVFCRSLALQLKSMPFDRAQKCQEKLQAVISAELDQLDAPSSPKRWIQVEILPSTSVTSPETSLIDIKVEPAELP